MELDFQQFIPSLPFLLKGITVTLKIVFVAGILGFVLGIVLSILKISKFPVLSWIADAYTSIFRGTPLVLQLMIIYYGTPQITGVQIEPAAAAILSFGLNSAAYISEIIRAGILAVDKGQKEAALALGVNNRQAMFDLILPQALKNIFPALINEAVSLTKESAIVTVIGVTDIMRRAYIMGGDKFSYFEPLLLAGVIYYVMVMVLTLLAKVLERRMRRSD
ncbi:MULTISPECIES: amino acid ABC transporter permease [Niallia]|uniref:Amino acid ABC transporter permease n=2 Tax=Niallia TaxID=2837506 RepID=A0A437KE13_9BACI|nr:MULTISPECIES: amino acid ABC transporter permease [Niallia]MCM3215452.1 amino acid ABC transporter permease [Niallia taxi]MCT2346243.1 amino acid ABC transporter permease [Niallia taxi]MDE5052090.1 amino acid ABC transporter permease [Niallia taxi]MDK8639754.1 amino acid ABC transporter permease [Niallia taxi]MED3961944.1 amino acid ABC transporter permease [Niallia taxi]